MTYKLRFHELALAEWRKLDGSVREPLKKKMTERLVITATTVAAGRGLFAGKARKSLTDSEIRERIAARLKARDAATKSVE